MIHRKRESITSAFTLIELLVVIAIISILATLLIPSLVQAREYAKKSVCTNNLHQVSVSMAMYKMDYRIVPIYFVWAEEYLEDPKILVCPSDDYEGLYKASPWKLDIPYDPMHSTPGSSYWSLPLFYDWWRYKRNISIAMCMEISGVPVTASELGRTPYSHSEYLTYLRCINRHDAPYSLHLLGGGTVVDYYPPPTNPTSVWEYPHWYTNGGMGW